MATRRKPNVSLIQEFGTMAWVWMLDVGKLEPRAVEGCFVGFDDEAEGYRVYWPQKKSVTVKCNVYFNRDEALQTASKYIQIEGEMGTNFNPDSTTTPTPHKEVANNPETVDMTADSLNETPSNGNPKKLPQNIKNSHQNNQNPPESSQITLIPPPHQRTMWQ